MLHVLVHRQMVSRSTGIPTRPDIDNGPKEVNSFKNSFFFTKNVSAKEEGKSVLVQSLECSSTQGGKVEGDLNIAVVEMEKLDQELMSLETHELKGKPLSKHHVPTANEL